MRKRTFLLCLAIGMQYISVQSTTYSPTSLATKDNKATETPTPGNPYLPLWEHIPDGEPYVFEDPDCPGKQRVYIYGSHDSRLTDYCGHELVLWSASTDSLWNWRYEGEILQVKTDSKGNLLNKDGESDILFAPDVAVRTAKDGTKTYYLYPNDQAGNRNSLVAKSSRPDGPFEICNWNEEKSDHTNGPIQFDPAVFVDDDGRTYAYWGFMRSFAGELDASNMATLKPGTVIVEDMISNLKQPGIFRFFEASSIRKIKDKYVFIYSRWTKDGEFGLPNTNYTLAYAYSNSPLGPWRYGGTIIDARGRDINEQGDTIVTATPSANTHGSICEINGKWYVFYHRQTGTNEYARQAMVAPITVNVEKGPDGKVEISEGEYTSEGFALNGLNPLERHSAGIACWYTGPKPWKKHGDDFRSGSYVEASYGTADKFKHPYEIQNNTNRVINNNDGSIVGYKYFNFDVTYGRKDVQLSLRLIPEGIDGTITIWADRPWKSQGGKELGKIKLKSNMPQLSTETVTSLSSLGKLKGKHALFFVFESKTKGKSICKLEDFIFK